MGKLDSINPERLVYENGSLTLTVLGGIKPEGLDRLRVTLKLEIPESPRPALRHNLDLYNDTQVEKLVRRAAERLEAGTGMLSGALCELTERLEEYRMAQRKGAGEESGGTRAPSPEERSAAETFLRSENLLEKTNALIGESGVIGEETNRLLMYLIFTSRKREEPLHCLSLGSSGTGKTHLQEKVGRLIPEEERLEITTLSENAFYYFGHRELRHKLLLIEDLDGADNVLYPMRELMSKRKISKTLAHKSAKGETRTIHLTVEGPVSVAGCTTRESVYEDNANRSFLLYLDESAEQDEKIMAYQRARSAGRINAEGEAKAAELLRNCQRILEPVRVINPYAELLEIPREVFKPRRSNAHYLAFIEAVTFYHQYQREVKTRDRHGGIVEPYIETTLGDIRHANRLMEEVLLRKSDGLTGACRNYLERLKKWLGEERKTAFTNAQARAALRENHSNQKRYMLQLQQEGMVIRGQGDRKRGFYYEVCGREEYERLKAGITGVLEDILSRLEKETPHPTGPGEAAQSPGEVQAAVEPLKPYHTKAKGKKSKSPGEGKRPTYEESLAITLAALHGTLAEKPEGHATAGEVGASTGRSRETEGRNLKALSEGGRCERIWKNRQYLYRPIPIPVAKRSMERSVINT